MVQRGAKMSKTMYEKVCALSGRNRLVKVLVEWRAIPAQLVPVLKQAADRVFACREAWGHTCPLFQKRNTSFCCREDVFARCFPGRSLPKGIKFVCAAFRDEAVAWLQHGGPWDSGSGPTPIFCDKFYSDLNRLLATMHAEKWLDTEPAMPDPPCGSCAGDSKDMVHDGVARCFLTGSACSMLPVVPMSVLEGRDYVVSELEFLHKAFRSWLEVGTGVPSCLCSSDNHDRCRVFFKLVCERLKLSVTVADLAPFTCLVFRESVLAGLRRVVGHGGSGSAAAVTDAAVGTGGSAAADTDAVLLASAWTTLSTLTCLMRSLPALERNRVVFHRRTNDCGTSVGVLVPRSIVLGQASVPVVWQFGWVNCLGFPGFFPGRVVDPCSDELILDADVKSMWNERPDKDNALLVQFFEANDEQWYGIADSRYFYALKSPGGETLCRLCVGRVREDFENMQKVLHREGYAPSGLWKQVRGHAEHVRTHVWSLLPLFIIFRFCWVCFIF
jgi:hypothetical protein